MRRTTRIDEKHASKINQALAEYRPSSGIARLARNLGVERTRRSLLTWRGPGEVNWLARSSSRAGTTTNVVTVTRAWYEPLGYQPGAKSLSYQA